MEEDKTPKKRPKLTPKQEKFVVEYAKNGGNGTKAALAAYDTDNYGVANQIAHENLKKPTIYEEARAALAKHNVTLDRMSKVVSDALDAEDDGKIKHETRLNAVKTAATLYKLGEREKDVQINIGEVKGLEVVFKNYADDKE